MEKVSITEVLANWRLPQDGDPVERVDRMIRPALLEGYFRTSFTRFVAGSQYHLGGTKDTQELAELAHISPTDHVLDVCCFIGGPAVELAARFGCRVTGVDLSRDAIAAANRIAELTGLSHQAVFQVADASALPFPDRTFTVAWNQCSLRHDPKWLKELDRMLVPGGRLALTFQLRGRNCQKDGPFSRWTLPDVISVVEGMGYSVTHAQDITDRDIEIGWRQLDRILERDRAEFTAVLGEEWGQKAHQEFLGEIEAMRAGRWGNGRLIAVKPITTLG